MCSFGAVGLQATANNEVSGPTPRHRITQNAAGSNNNNKETVVAGGSRRASRHLSIVPSFVDGWISHGSDGVLESIHTEYD